MGKIQIGVILVIFALILSAGEFIWKKNDFLNLAIQNEEIGKIPNSEDYFADSIAKPDPKKSFDLQKLSNNGIFLEPDSFSDAVFRHLPIDNQKEDFFLETFTFIKETDVEKIDGKVTIFLPKKEFLTGELFSLIKEKLMQAIKNSPENEVEINQTDTLGDGNFYLNDKNFPETVFLVVRSGAKILAFEYEKRQHESVKKILPVFFEIWPKK